MGTTSTTSSANTESWNGFQQRWDACATRVAAHAEFKRFSLLKLKCHRSRDGYKFSAALCLDGLPVGSVSNEGRGGPTMVRFEPGADTAPFKALEDVAREVSEYEPSGLVVEEMLIAHAAV